MTAQHPSLWRRLDQSGAPLLIARLVLGGMFVWMGYQKIVSDPVYFLKLVRQFGVLPEEPAILLNGTAIVLPWMEVFCGTALLLGVFVRGATAWLLFMLSIFTPVVFLKAWQMHTIDGIPFMQVKFDCGCGAGEVIIWKKLLENVGLWMLALYALFSGTRRFCLALLFERRRANSPYCRQCGYVARGGAPCDCGRPDERSALPGAVEPSV